MMATRPVVAMEISCLGERNYTGIANVTRMLARELLGDANVEARFFMGRNEMPIGFVEKLLRLNGGEILWWLSGRFGGLPDYAGALDRPVIGLFPSTKLHRRLFPFEVLIVHDLTTVVTPQYHTTDTLAFWQRQLLPDMLSSDLLVAVSHSTASDIRTYFRQVYDVPCVVVPEAPCVAEVPALPEGLVAAPYILVLGTLEPRKNVEQVFELLAAHPVLMAMATFVFVGRWGWGPQAADLMRTYGLDRAVVEGKIVMTGFIADAARDRLLASALAVIYPSAYEGFGLPILEAMFYGTAVITTFSTSLPEVGGDRAVYFDPLSAESLHLAIRRVLELSAAATEGQARADRKAWARQFTWERTYQAIRDAALDHHAQR